MKSFAVIAGLSFIGFMLTSLWPKYCLDRAKQRLQELGDDPNVIFGLRRLQAVVPDLYRSYIVGLILSSLLGIAFIVFVILAFINR